MEVIQEDVEDARDEAGLKAEAPAVGEDEGLEDGELRGGSEEEDLKDKGSEQESEEEDEPKSVIEVRHIEVCH
eukprot:scaffold33948_cov17-Prasinocladus_malaysianus.AAC.1